MAVSISASLKTVKNQLHTAGALLWLFEFTRSVGTIARYALYNESITYNGDTYTPISAKVEALVQDRQSIGKFRVSVSNITGTVQQFVDVGEIKGRRVTVTVVSADYLTVADHGVEMTFYCEEVTATDEAVTFTLGLGPLMQTRFPRDRFIQDRCRWAFKSTECGYTGGIGNCSKSLKGSGGCEQKQNEDRYGGFPDMLVGDQSFPKL
jgi:phage-related protein